MSLEAIGQGLVKKGYAKKNRWCLLQQHQTAGAKGSLRQQIDRLYQDNQRRTIALYEASLPFCHDLVQRAAPMATRLVPRDSETAVFLGDIPLINLEAGAQNTHPLPNHRHAFLTKDGLCLLAADKPAELPLLAACLHHASYVTYLADLLTDGTALSHEKNRASFIGALATPLQKSPLPNASLERQIVAAGQRMVDLGLVDSVFGNASFRSDEQIFISGTGVALDQLEGGLVKVNVAGQDADDRWASSELAAHRALYQRTGAKVALHGHSRFAVALSLARSDLLPAGIPSICAPPGTTELGQKVGQALQQADIVMITGHGPFAIGADFNRALDTLISFENACRQTYRRCLETRDRQ